MSVNEHRKKRVDRDDHRFFERCGGASRQVVRSGKVALRKAFRRAIVPSNKDIATPFNLAI